MADTGTGALPRLGVARWPFYYGWVSLGMAALAMVGTLPGRTQGLGLVTEPLMRDLSIDRVLFAEINLVATLVGSLFCLGIGRLIDRAGSRSVLTAISLCLGAAVLAMSGTRGVWPLLVLITLTRGFGQSALSVASLALVGKWFSRRLSLAMGVYALAMSIGFMAAFPAVGAAVQASGWRVAWAGVGLALVLVLAPLSWLLVRSTPESVGLEVDGGGGPVEDAAAAEGATLEEALRHAGLLGVRARRVRLRPRRLGDRPLQRVDPRRARVRSIDLLPHAGGHGSHRPRRQLRGRGLRLARLPAPAAGGGDAAPDRVAGRPASRDARRPR